MTKTKLNGYYKAKVEAMAYVKKLALAETDLLTIKLYIKETYGFGDLFVMRYLEDLENNGNIKVTGDKIKSFVKNEEEESINAVLGANVSKD